MKQINKISWDQESWSDSKINIIHQMQIRDRCCVGQMTQYVLTIFPSCIKLPLHIYLSFLTTRKKIRKCCPITGHLQNEKYFVSVQKKKKNVCVCRMFPMKPLLEVTSRRGKWKESITYVQHSKLLNMHVCCM